MDTKIFHGKINPDDLAQALVAHFNRGNFIVQKIGDNSKLAVQIATSQRAISGGQTALSVLFQKVDDGVAVQIGKQSWMSVAASLGFSALAALLNPWNLLGRLDDIAQDVESLQLSEEVWKVIDATARSLGSGYELSARLKRMQCDYCGVANPVGQASCLACGAPLGNAQPKTCPKCGFVVHPSEKYCPNCGAQTV
jgi:Double zinc ribbon